MSILVEAVKAGSLSAAGRKMGMPLATVSRKLSELEAYLKTPLLIRSNRRLTLTDAGRDYLSSVSRILEDISEAERTASGEFSEPKGDLAITAPIVFGRLHVLPVVAAFLKAFPEIRVRLAMSDRVANISEDLIDMAVRIGRLPDSSLMAVKVGTIGQMVVASPDYLKMQGIPLAPRDLAQHDCVNFDGLNAPDIWRFLSGKQEILAPVNARLSVNTAEAAIDAAIASVGLTRVFSYQVANALASGTLVRVMQNFEQADVPVSLVYAGQRKVARKLRAFIDFSAPMLRARLSDRSGSPQ